MSDGYVVLNKTARSVWSGGAVGCALRCRHHAIGGLVHLDHKIKYMSARGRGARCARASEHRAHSKSLINYITISHGVHGFSRLLRLSARS